MDVEGFSLHLIKCNLCSKWVCEDCNEVPVGKPTTEDANNINAMKSFQDIFECKISQMESKLQMLIDDKLGQKIEVLPKLSERMEEQHQASDMPNTEVVNSSKAVSGSIDFRKIMREAINEEKVEEKEKEKEKRSKNFIVHGLAEIGEQNEDIKENDVKIIKSFLHTVGTTSEPESFTRLGSQTNVKGGQ